MSDKHSVALEFEGESVVFWKFICGKHSKCREIKCLVSLTGDFEDGRHVLALSRMSNI